jgi:hypothetical protein
MCAKPERPEVFRPLAELTQELAEYDQIQVRNLPWAGVTVYYGLLENV